MLLILLDSHNMSGITQVTYDSSNKRVKKTKTNDQRPLVHHIPK